MHVDMAEAYHIFNSTSPHCVYFINFAQKTDKYQLLQCHCLKYNIFKWTSMFTNWFVHPEDVMVQLIELCLFTEER